MTIIASQIDDEFRILNGVTKAVDLCAAPGSWSQVLARRLKGIDGAKIVGQDGEYLGQLGPSWNRDSIYNSSSEYSSTWSSNSIFNDSSKYGNSYSSTSVFNESASSPPKIITEDGEERYLSIGPSWDSNRLNPYDFKYTCDWD